MDLNRPHASEAGGKDDEPRRDAATERAPGLAQAVSTVTRWLRLAPGPDATDRGGDAAGDDVAADPEAIRRAFLDAALEPARRPPRRSQSDQPEPPSELVGVGPGVAQPAVEEVAPVVAEPVPKVVEVVAEPVVAGPPSASLAGAALVGPDASTDNTAVDEVPPPTSLRPSAGAMPSVPAPVPEPGDVPESVTVAADDFFADLVRRVGRRP